MVVSSISSVSKEVAIQLVREGELPLVLLAASMILQRLQHTTAIQQDQIHRVVQEQPVEVKEEIIRVLQTVRSHEMRTVSTTSAFNSGPAFLSMFQAAAVAAIPLTLLDLFCAIKRVSWSLDGIRSELATANVAKVQDWEKDGFGSHVYRFIKNEMDSVARQDAWHVLNDQHHFFYVWNPDTDWYPIFEEKLKTRPLGAEFGGYHTDLATICLRMRSDRETLIQTTAYGRTARFHLLIPAYSPIVVDNPIRFHKALFPLVLTGQKHQGVDFVWLNLDCRNRGDPSLVNVSGLPAQMSSCETITYGGGTSMATYAAGTIACAVASTAFLLLAPALLVAKAFAGPAMLTSMTTLIGGLMCCAILEEDPLVLGDAIFLLSEGGGQHGEETLSN